MDLVPSDKERGLQTPVWNHYEALLLYAGCKVGVALSSGGSGRVNHGSREGKGLSEL